MGLKKRCNLYESAKTLAIAEIDKSKTIIAKIDFFMASPLHCLKMNKATSTTLDESWISNPFSARIVMCKPETVRKLNSTFNYSGAPIGPVAPERINPAQK